MFGMEIDFMEIPWVLLPIALGFVLCAVVAFGWAARSGQFDDLDTPALRVLLDDGPPPQGGVR
ncbi:MAG: cbb3-type cytochrome oxidase maturation protein [Bradymonadia bacterium]|jgi:cbb3-type cytochrome oxidase maturation protein